jgi:FtsP/CotA-like multicopper oxidase with cupredoxin domain
MHLDKERQHMRPLNHDHEGDKAMSPHDQHGVPGTWMVHCHIAEHLEGGMMFSFGVEE